MVWGYLTEFWDAITDSVVGGITYTIEWFQMIGNAVAGAIGSLFDDLIHHFYDVFLLFSWFYDNLSNMFSIVFTPLFWIFNFTKGFLTSATSTLEELNIQLEEVELYTTNVASFFDAIPYFNFLLAGGGALIGIFFVIFIIKKLIHI
jgi:hypothetical protein